MIIIIVIHSENCQVMGDVEFFLGPDFLKPSQYVV